jgi:hypothetical protein
MNDDPNSEDEYIVKGLTTGYVTDIVRINGKYGIERRALILNDYFALYITFENVSKQFAD